MCLKIFFDKLFKDCCKIYRFENGYVCKVNHKTFLVKNCHTWHEEYASPFFRDYCVFKTKKSIKQTLETRKKVFNHDYIITYEDD